MKCIAILLLLGFSCSVFGQDTITSYGVLPPTEAELLSHPQKKRFKLPSGYVLPDSCDLFATMPEARDQGGQFNCGAWAIVYTLKSYQEKIRNNRNYTDETLFSPAFIYNLEMQKLGVTDCNSGLTLDTVLDDLKDYGVLSLKDFPYRTKDKLGCLKNPVPDPFKNKVMMEKALTHKITTYEPLSVYDNEEEIKYHLSQKRPVAVQIAIDTEFRDKGYSSENKDKYLYNPHPDTPKNIQHAMVCIGYDDLKKEFRFMNSWGAGWGTNGTVYIPYGKFNEIAILARYLNEPIPSDSLKTKDLKEETKGRTNDITLNVPIESWLKKGYYRKYGNLRVSLIYLNRKQKKIIIRFSDSITRQIISDTQFTIEDSKSFYFRGNKVTFSFDTIGRAGSLFSFKGPAAFFTVVFETRDYDPNIEGVLDKFR